MLGHLPVIGVNWVGIMNPSSCPKSPMISFFDAPFDSPDPSHGEDESRLVGVMGRLLCSAWLCCALQQVHGCSCAQVLWAGEFLGMMQMMGTSLVTIDAYLSH